MSRNKDILRHSILPCLVMVLAICAVVLMPAREAVSHEQASGNALSRSASSALQNNFWSLPAALTHAQEPRWEDVQVRPGDTLSGIFHRLNLPSRYWRNILALNGHTAALKNMRPGDVLKVRFNHMGGLKALRYKLGSRKILLVKWRGEGWQQSVRTLKTQRRREVDEGTVRKTLYGSLRDAGLTPGQIAQFNNIFHWDINLSRSIHSGDTFTVVFNRLYRDGKEVGHGPIEAAELHSGGQTIRIVRYKNKQGDVGYYHPNGQAVHAVLNRAPVHYVYISSPFSLRRFNPVLHVYRPHYGVDYAAPTGTPIHAAGDGRIIYRGRDGGYGNLIEIKNAGPYSTRYAHMSRFKAGLHVGSHVKKGQVIGYVGQTGVATGPHLHFEIRVNGHPKNPRTVSLAGYKAIPKVRMKYYSAKIGPLLSILDHNSVMVARNSPDIMDTPTK